jgi:hypothetical protein
MQPLRSAAAQILDDPKREAEMTSVGNLSLQTSSPFAPVAAAFRHLAARLLAAAETLRNRERDRPSRLSGAPLHYLDGHRHRDGAPRGVFDPLFSGLSANAAGVDAAIRRRTDRSAS